MEILDQRAIRCHRLGANASAAGLEVVLANLRHQPLQRLAEQTFAERTFQFLPTHPLVLSEKPPETGETQRVSKVSQVDIRFAIAFASEGQNRVRTRFNAAFDQ